MLLGDILYHGPRNDLPEGYAPKKTAELLNARREKILCVRGNCDAEVDQMMLKFPIMADYCVISDGSQLVYASHGHIYNCDNLPPLSRGDILMCGHTHVPGYKMCGDCIYMNPGSVSIPKENSWHGYIIWNEGLFRWKDLDGNEKMQFSLPQG